MHFVFGNFGGELEVEGRVEAVVNLYKKERESRVWG